MADESRGIGVILGFLIGVPIGIAIFWYLRRRTTTPTATKTYTNLEAWDVIKDERGRTVGIRVHRNATEA